MIIIEDVEREAEETANGMTVELVMLLLDKWEQDLVNQERLGYLNVDSLLNHYVNLKITMHHLNKSWLHEWSSGPKTENEFVTKYNFLFDKVKEARRNYYVARRKFRETEHGKRCACRGCRCIKGIERTS